MKMKRYTIPLTVFLIILITSCGSSDPAPRYRSDLYKGSVAIDMNFLVNAPPSELYENSPFRVGVHLKNSGAGHDTNGILLIGYEEDYIEFGEDSRYYTQNRVDFNLEGRTLQNLYGQDEKFLFELSTKDVDRMTTHHESNIYVTACYDFMTFATVEVCIDTDIYNERDNEKVCRVSDTLLKDQGAPVAIKRIEHEMLPDGLDLIKPTFKIYVQNVGSGKVINENSVEKACSSETLSKDEDMDIIDIEVKMGGVSLECAPLPLHLQRNNDFVRCWHPDGINTNFVTFQSFLEIKLSYGYMETISRNIDIKRIIE